MTLRPYLLRKEKVPQGWEAMVQIARWVFFCVERSWCFNASLSRYREHAFRFERVEVVGGCSTEEPARYKVAVAVFAKAGIGIRGVPFRRMR